MRKDVRKIAIGGVCVLTGVILIFGIKKGITVLKTEKTETKKGVEVIRKLEQADISQIEGKILELERSEMEANPELYSQSMKARFSTCVRGFNHRRICGIRFSERVFSHCRAWNESDRCDRET